MTINIHPAVAFVLLVVTAWTVWRLMDRKEKW